MREPSAPSWDHRDPSWRLEDLPGSICPAVWRRQWDWLRGARSPDAGSNEASMPAACSAPIRANACAAINAARPQRRRAAPAHTSRRSPRLLTDPVEPVAVDAAYAMAAAGADAVPYLARRDPAPTTTTRTSTDRSSHDGSRPDPRRWRRAAPRYGLAEIGAPAVSRPARVAGERQRRGRASWRPSRWAKSRARRRTSPTRSAAPRAIRRRPFGSTRWRRSDLKPATPSSVAALSEAIRDPDAQVRFSAALSLAQIGPAADAAVPALEDALLRRQPLRAGLCGRGAGTDRDADARCRSCCRSSNRALVPAYVAVQHLLEASGTTGGVTPPEQNSGSER